MGPSGLFSSPQPNAHRFLVGCFPHSWACLVPRWFALRSTEQTTTSAWAANRTASPHHSVTVRTDFPGRTSSLAFRHCARVTACPSLLRAFLPKRPSKRHYFCHSLATPSPGSPPTPTPTPAPSNPVRRNRDKCSPKAPEATAGDSQGVVSLSVSHPPTRPPQGRAHTSCAAPPPLPSPSVDNGTVLGLLLLHSVPARQTRKKRRWVWVIHGYPCPRSVPANSP